MLWSRSAWKSLVDWCSLGCHISALYLLCNSDSSGELHCSLDFLCWFLEMNDCLLSIYQIRPLWMCSHSPLEWWSPQVREVASWMQHWKTNRSFSNISQEKLIANTKPLKAFVKWCIVQFYFPFLVCCVFFWYFSTWLFLFGCASDVYTQAASSNYSSKSSRYLQGNGLFGDWLAVAMLRGMQHIRRPLFKNSWTWCAFGTLAPIPL